MNPNELRVHTQTVYKHELAFLTWQMGLTDGNIDWVTKNGDDVDAKYAFYLAIEEPELFAEVIKAIKGES